MRRFCIFVFIFYTVFAIAQNNFSFIIKDRDGSESANVSCATPFVAPQTLTAEYTPLSRTSDYSVVPATYNPIVPFNEGTPMNTSGNNDKFLESIIPIGFDFCFYDKPYSELVIGTNGVVSFDTSYAGQIIFPGFSQANPNSLLPVNAIFGAYQALVYDSEAEIFVERTGTAPNRKLVISFYNAKYLYNGSGDVANCEKRTSTQIVLNETTNEITVYIENRPMPCADSGFRNALVGIQNATGTAGRSPNRRNTGVWAANNEAYTFKPNGSAITPTITWYDTDGTTIGQGQTLTLNSASNLGNITAKATFDICNKKYEFTDDYEFNIASDYPSGRDYSTTVCSNGTIDLRDYISGFQVKNSGNFDFRFFKSPTEAKQGIGTEYTTDTINSDTLYHVRVQNKSQPDCYIILQLRINLISTVLKATSVEVCEALSSNYKLATLTKLLIDPGYTGSVTYFTDAAGTMSVSTLDLTNGRKLWLKLDGCPDILGPVTVNLKSGPSINSPLTHTETLCDNDANGDEPFSFEALNAQLVNNYDPTLYNINYFRTYDNALKNVNSISTVKQGTYKLYARVEDVNEGCFSIGEIEMNITFNKVEAKNADIYICFDGTSDKTIDLTDPTLIKNMKGSGTSETSETVTFYRLRDDAITGANPITSFLLTKDGDFTTETVYVRFTSDSCYTVRELRFHQVNPKNNAPDPIPVCDSKNDGTETITLENYNQRIAGGQKLIITYYSDENYTNVISSKDIALGSLNTVYVEVKSGYDIYSGICDRRFSINFSLNSGPDINSAPAPIIKNNECDNNGDGYELFDITTQHNTINHLGLRGLRYEYYKDYDPATGNFSNRYSLINGKYIKINDNTPVTVYVRVIGSNGCSSKSEIKVAYVFNGNTIKLNPAKLENCSLDNTIVFDLTRASKQQFIPTENTQPLSDIEITYFKNYDPVTDQLSGPISSPYTVSRAKQTVYAKYFSKTTGCYSVAPIELITYLSPIARNTTIDFCEYSGIDLKTLENGALLGNGIDPAATYSYTYYLKDPNVTPTATGINSDEIFYPQNQQRIWFKVVVQSNLSIGCETFGFVDFNALPQLPYTPPAPFVDNTTCDVGNDGIETITSLRQFESVVRQKYPAATFAYYESFPDKPINPDAYRFDAAKMQKIKMIISNGTACPTAVDIAIELKKTPAFTFKNGDYYFCENGGSVDVIPNTSYIRANRLNPTEFLWTLPNGTTTTTDEAKYTANVAGTYKLTITTDNGCSYTESFVVKTYETPEIYKIVVEGNKVTVLAKAPDNTRKIMYTYDGLNTWSSSYIFHNVPPGKRTFYVRYENNEYESGCIGMPMKTLVLEDTNVITPNGDGMNDKWVIKNLDLFEGKNSNLKIFDRYNKLLYEQTNNSELSWDGFYNGRVLPTSSYWYVLTLPDGRQLTGWILVKNIE